MKGGSLSPLSLKCASNELHGSVGDLRGYYFQFLNLGCMEPLGGPQVFILGVNSYLDFDHNILEILLSRGPSQVITAGGSRFTLFFKH